MHPHDAGLHGGFDTDAEFHLHHAHLADGQVREGAGLEAGLRDFKHLERRGRSVRLVLDAKRGRAADGEALVAPQGSNRGCRP